MNGLEALKKVEAKVRTMIDDNREIYNWEKKIYEKLKPGDYYSEYHYQEMYTALCEIKMLKTVLIWIDDAKEECEEEL